MMNLQMLAQHPSTHPGFQRRPDMSPTRVRWNQDADWKKKFRRSGPIGTAHLTWSKYGMICGLLEGLADHPIEGTVTVTISRSSYSVTGQINLFDATRQTFVHKSLQAVEQIAYELSVDDSVQAMAVTYIQHIKDIEGGVLVP